MAEGRSSPLDRYATREGNAGDVGFQERVIALYETHRDGIYRFLVGHGLNPAMAQDVTQDVFVDLFVALEKGTTVNSEQGWLYTVAGRAVADYWRRDHRSIWVELDSNPMMGANIPSGELTPEARAGHREQINRVAAGLKRLPKEHRLCIGLRMQGLRYREIAKVLKVSTSTIAEWLASAVDRLRGDAHD
jgi:RNA polymerase sigma-70 factor (ECF subfamily)